MVYSVGEWLSFWSAAAALACSSRVHAPLYVLTLGGVAPLGALFWYYSVVSVCFCEFISRRKWRVFSSLQTIVILMQNKYRQMTGGVRIYCRQRQ